MRVLVTGATGFLGKHVLARLKHEQCEVMKPVGRNSMDLRKQRDAEGVIRDYRPDTVIHLAASVGGIQANQRQPGTYFRDNMLMGVNTIHAAAMNGVKRFVLVGTVCSYPKFCDTPFVEKDLFNGFPEETNAPYGISKRALAVMLDGYREEFGLSGVTVIPTNLYGPGDCFDDDRSHVIPALLKKFIQATDTVECWGDGSASRDFLYVEDAADAIVRAAGSDCTGHINVGSGVECSIKELAEAISDATGFSGEITWDESKPNGQPHRQVSFQKAKRILGWSPRTSLRNGIAKTFQSVSVGVMGLTS